MSFSSTVDQVEQYRHKCKSFNFYLRYEQIYLHIQYGSDILFVTFFLQSLSFKSPLLQYKSKEVSVITTGFSLTGSKMCKICWINLCLVLVQMYLNVSVCMCLCIRKMQQEFVIASSKNHYWGISETHSGYNSGLLYFFDQCKLLLDTITVLACVPKPNIKMKQFSEEFH